MRILLTVLFCLCLLLQGADKEKTDVEKDGYKGRVKSVKVSGFKIEEKDGRQVRTQVRTARPSAKYDEKGNRVEEVEYDANGKISFKYISKYDEKGNQIKQTTSVLKTPNRETRYGFVIPDEKTWEFTYWD